MARSDDYLMGRRDALGDVLMLMREVGMAGRSPSSVVGQVEEMRDEASLALRRHKDAARASDERCK